MEEENLKSLIQELQKALDEKIPVVIWTRERRNKHTKFYGTDTYYLDKPTRIIELD